MLNVLAGITSVRDMGNDNATLQQVMQEERAGQLLKILAPIVLAFIVKLTSSKSLLGEHVSPRWLRIAGWSSVAILAVLNVGIVLVNILGLAA